MVDMTWEAAIIEVLRNADEAMHYRDITDEILSSGLVTTVGATPARTVSARITTSLNKEGDNSPFIKTERGVYMLREQTMKADRNQPPKQGGTEEAVGVEQESRGIVQAMGMYWRADRVIWELTSPKILGQENERAEPVDFCNQIAVYLLHDRARVIYVGQTNSLGERLRYHTNHRLNERWDRFSWFGLKGVDNEGKLIDAAPSFAPQDVLTMMEALLIEALETPQNRRRGDGLNNVEFFQVADPEIDKERERAIRLLLGGAGRRR